MKQTKQKLAFNPTDFAFAIIKLIAVAGALAWGLYHPMAARDKVVFLWLLGVFSVYTMMLYFSVFKFPGNATKLYFLELVLDLIFISFLIPITGGRKSVFMLAFFLLAAIHSFYFGLMGSIGIGLLVSFAYIFSCPSCLFESHWTDTFLKVIFVLILSITLGYLSERERKIHRQLVNAEQLAAMGMFFSQLAHAVRNPLSTISLSAELLGDELKKFQGADTKEASNLISSIMNEVQRVNDVVEDHLRFMRRSKTEYANCDTNGILNSIAKFLEKEASRRGISFVRTFETPMPDVKIGESQLRQVLLNIIRNSFDAMPHGGQIRLTTRRLKDDVEITVEDTGIGISREDLRRVFDPFFTTKDVGTGLGLFIARDVVLEHHGGITCDSRKGVGTTVKLRLPAAA